MRWSPHLLPDTDPLHKVTIIPRGMALGLDAAAPHRGEAQLHEGAAPGPDRGLHGRPHRRGHRVRRDLDRRPERHRAGHRDGPQDGLRMGHERALGPLTYGKKEEQIFLGKEFNRHQDYSEATALKIDAEIKRIVTEQYERAQRTPHRLPRRAQPRRGGPARARGPRRRAAQGAGGGTSHRGPPARSPRRPAAGGEGRARGRTSRRHPDAADARTEAYVVGELGAARRAPRTRLAPAAS